MMKNKTLAIVERFLDAIVQMPDSSRVVGLSDLELRRLKMRQVADDPWIKQHASIQITEDPSLRAQITLFSNSPGSCLSGSLWIGPYSAQQFSRAFSTNGQYMLLFEDNYFDCINLNEVKKIIDAILHAGDAFQLGRDYTPEGLRDASILLDLYHKTTRYFRSAAMDFYAIYHLKYDKYEAQHEADQPQNPEILVSSGVDYEEDLLYDENKGVPWNSGFICVLKPTGGDGKLDHSVLQNESIQLQISYNARMEILEHIIHFNLPAVSTVYFRTTQSATVPPMTIPKLQGIAKDCSLFLHALAFVKRELLPLGEDWHSIMDTRLRDRPTRGNVLGFICMDRLYKTSHVRQWITDNAQSTGLVQNTLSQFGAFLFNRT
jgi:hypothetical protein